MNKSSSLVRFMLICCVLALALPALGVSGALAAEGDVVLASCTASGVQGDAMSWISRISDDGRYVAFQTSAGNLIPGSTFTNICRKDLQTGAIAVVSCDSTGTLGNSASSTPDMSADGRYVFFYSPSTNLVAGADNGKYHVYRKDMDTGEVKLCSCDSSGTQGNDDSQSAPSPSADGRYVAFDSRATNLVTPGTTQIQVFLKDMDTGTVTICSTNASGVVGAWPSQNPRLTPDARYAAFQSIADNLGYGSSSYWQDYRKDLQTGEVLLVSGDTGGIMGNQNSYPAGITADGRFAVFNSSSSNLVPGSDGTQIYRKDLDTGEIALVSCSKAGEPGDLNSVGASISGDGKRVAFDSFSRNLIPDSNLSRQVYCKNMETGEVVLVSSDASGAIGNDWSEGCDMTPDARYVTFASDATNLGYATTVMQVFRKELASPGFTFYFAEGYTGPGFQEYLCLGNPGDTEVAVGVTYLFADGTSHAETYAVPALSRFTADVNAEVGADRNVSIQCTAASPFVAERPMYFDYTGAGESWTGGHDAVGATSTSETWYFAEGYTGPGFNEWICVLNPGDDPAKLKFHFQTQEAGLIEPEGDFGVPAHSRATFKANDLLGGVSYQTSLALTSDVPVVAERPMYFSYQGTAYWGWTGGHCVMGVPTLSKDYYFAEGYTGDGFEEWLTLQNPGSSAITVDAVYQLGSGTPVTDYYEIPANTRVTVYVPDVVGTDQDVSVHLSSASDFLAERPMYFYYTGTASWDWTGGHCVIGATAQATEWFFAEGYTGDGFEEWLCIQNPGPTAASVEIVYYPEGGAPIVKDAFTVAANSRATVNVNTDAGSGLSLCAGLASDQPVIVERPMYFNFRGAWTGGHDVVGYMP